MKRLLRALFLLLLLGLTGAALLLQSAPSVPLRDPSALGDQVAQAHAAFKRNDPRGQAPGVRPLRLSESELEGLLELGLNRWRPARADLRLAPGEAEVQLSIELPLPWRWRWRWRWLNIDTRWQQAPSAALWPALSSLRVGHLPLPASVSGWLLHQAARQALGEDDLKLARGLLRELIFESHGVDLRYEWQPDTARQLASRLWPEVERERLRVYEARIGELSQAYPPGSPVPLTPWLETLLRLAAQRSEGRVDIAAAEHRALILSLGLYASGQTWGRFIPQAREWPRPRPQVLLLGGREDFALHLLISAVLAIEGGGPVTDAIGLYKEIADSRGGSGFSFNDLAVDLAGKRLGLLSQQAPLRLQGFAAGTVQESDFTPAVADLPEFLSAEQFQRDYGGPDGAPYRALMARIEARVDALPWFR
ncbi:hypothetical protein [Roseateles amylovorans]|uniref:Uncharacterized protein n=1 Tax=Roseateles amylovorans TaxID=2978473 RepID=A0ABY6B4Z4_9BURK|nr:hypothetical protein [Roseateles amylovorans]UXH78335.1 hypothetical protein N4261_25870 [Roseateles amylovorans]